jgi:DNA-binding NarL/FixJ family response regulator
VSTIRVLVVEDFPAFRRFITSTLGARRDLLIIGVASDGPEGVQKAVELKPDLVLLDIGLPTMNGIEAARQIRQLVPAAKIVFLSQESSADVIQLALSTGALGYVVKSKAGSQLIRALDAVNLGKQFVSNP